MAEKYTPFEKKINYVGFIIGFVSFVLIMALLIFPIKDSPKFFITRKICQEENRFCETIETNEIRLYAERIRDCDDNSTTINCLKENCCYYEQILRKQIDKTDLTKQWLEDNCICYYGCAVVNVDGYSKTKCLDCDKYICGDYEVVILD